jgi:hypothetical protein
MCKSFPFSSVSPLRRLRMANVSQRNQRPQMPNIPLGLTITSPLIKRVPWFTQMQRLNLSWKLCNTTMWVNQPMKNFPHFAVFLGTFQSLPTFCVLLSSASEGPTTVQLVSFRTSSIEYAPQDPIEPGLISLMRQQKLPVGGNGYGAPPKGTQQTAGALGLGTVKATAVSQSFKMVGILAPFGVSILSNLSRSLSIACLLSLDMLQIHTPDVTNSYAGVSLYVVLLMF